MFPVGTEILRTFIMDDREIMMGKVYNNSFVKLEIESVTQKD